LRAGSGAGTSAPEPAAVPQLAAGRETITARGAPGEGVRPGTPLGEDPDASFQRRASGQESERYAVTVKLRLMRMGKKKQPTYRIVVADSRSPRDGRFIEIVGTYAPRAEPSVVKVDNAKALAWLSKGAQPTDTVRKLLEISGAWAEHAASHPKAASSRPAGEHVERTVATAGLPVEAEAEPAPAVADAGR